LLQNDIEILRRAGVKMIKNKNEVNIVRAPKFVAEYFMDGTKAYRFRYQRTNKFNFTTERNSSITRNQPQNIILKFFNFTKSKQLGK
jgi:hypothetical protein